MCCVRVWGLEVDEAKAFCGLSALLVGGVLQGNVFVFGFVLFVWHAVGCLEQHGCCSIDHPLYEQDLLGDALFWVSFGGCCLLGWCVV